MAETQGGSGRLRLEPGRAAIRDGVLFLTNHLERVKTAAFTVGSIMDSFERVVAEILWQEGYWVRTSLKVVLTREDKQKIGLPSMPRQEIDVVAYKAKANELLVVECKSYLDSPGIRLHAFDGTNEDAASRFKLFTRPVLRETVFSRLKQQLADAGSCAPDPTITLCLAAGHTNERERPAIKALFADRGWQLWDEPWLREHLKIMADGDYENEVSAVVAKLLLRS